MVRHTTPEQAAVVFSKVSPRLAVFSHSPRTAAIVEQTNRSYPGRVQMGTDLTVLTSEIALLSCAMRVAMTRRCGVKWRSFWRRKERHAENSQIRFGVELT